jgi:hypothetical protein
VAVFDQIFSLLCGQNSCWRPGGEALPFCQRCTGLYVGAAAAACLVFLFRPRPTSRMLWIHGLLLLLMVPFGYHLVPHGASVRTVTGQLFALGLVYYLSLLPTSRLGLRVKENGTGPYAVWVAVSVAALQVAVHVEAGGAGVLLTVFGGVGLLVLATLLVVNLLVLLKTP